MWFVLFRWARGGRGGRTATAAVAEAKIIKREETASLHLVRYAVGLALLPNPRTFEVQM